MLGYLKDHWQGEHSFARSVWANGILGYISFAILLAPIAKALGTKNAWVVFGFAIFGIWALWFLVGFWRAAYKKLKARQDILMVLLVGFIATVLAGKGVLVLFSLPVMVFRKYGLF